MRARLSRGLVVALAITAAIGAACTTILGDDFEIESGGGGADATGAAGSTGTAGTGGMAGAGGGPAECGDGETEGVEECDDGNVDAGDLCKPDCTRPRCRDGLLDPGQLCLPDPAVRYPIGRRRASDMELVDCDNDADLDIYLTTGDSTQASVTSLRWTGTQFETPYHYDLSQDYVPHVAVADIDNTGSPDAWAWWGPGGSVANKLFHLIGGAGCSFTLGSGTYDVYNVQDVETVAMSGDGLDDVVLATTNSITFFRPGDAAVTVLSFSGITPRGLAVGDINGDNFDDVVFTDFDTDQLHWRHGTGATFGPVASSSGLASGPQDVALADLNGDMRLDAITVNQNANSISVLLNDGSGGMVVAHGSIPIGGGPPAVTPVDIALGDLDNDGDIDAATVNRGATGGTGSVSVLLNRGDGDLGLATADDFVLVELDAPYPLHEYPTAIDLGDIDGNGALDIVVVHGSLNLANDSEVSVLFSAP